MPYPAGRFRDVLIMALMPLFFSSNLVIGRAAVAGVEPWSLAFFRWFGALLIVLPFAARPLWQERAALLAGGGSPRARRRVFCWRLPGRQ